MQPIINIDTTNGVANIFLQVPGSGTHVAANNIRLGATGHMTMQQVDAHARQLAKQALTAAIAAL